MSTASIESWVEELQRKHPDEGWRIGPYGFPVSAFDTITWTERPKRPRKAKGSR